MRKGLFLTRHQGEFSRHVDVDKLAGDYSEVAVTQVYDQLFQPNVLRDLLHQVKTYRLEAVVLAGYAAQRKETSVAGKALIDALKTQGINPNRIAFTDIYEPAALPHADPPAGADQTARLLIDTALARVEHCPEVATLAVRPKRTLLIVGTTAAGLLAANELLSKNMEVVLVDNTVSWRIANPGDATFAAFCDQVKSNPNAKIHFESEIADIAGWPGDYTITIDTPLGRKTLDVGGVLLCLRNDPQWIAKLPPRMRPYTDAEGFLLNTASNRLHGQTNESGIWLVNTSRAGNGLKPESSGVQQAVFALSELMDKPKLEFPLRVSKVDESVCRGCGACVKACAFAASGLDTERNISIIDVRRCRGCGNCVALCPAGARDLVTSPTMYVNKAIEILGRSGVSNAEPRILALLCKNSGRLAADLFGRQCRRSGGTGHAPNVLPLTMECGGSINNGYLLKALKEGFDGVALVVCNNRHCRNLVGSTELERRVSLLKTELRSHRMDDHRLRVIHTFGHETRRFGEALKAFGEELKRLKEISTPVC